jgi:GNAT superfamily N-acetyltransferase
MDGAEVRCREAVDDDWVGIWPIVAEVVRGGDTYVHSPDIGEEAARAMWMSMGAPRSATYVAVVDDRIVATAQLKPNQTGLGDHVANAGWMVAGAAAGRGVGRALADYVIGEARRLGFLGMQFNAVVSTNLRAIALWESLGFTIVGTVPRAFRHTEHGLVAVHIMYRDL